LIAELYENMLTSLFLVGVYGYHKFFTYSQKFSLFYGSGNIAIMLMYLWGKHYLAGSNKQHICGRQQVIQVTIATSALLKN